MVRVIRLNLNKFRSHCQLIECRWAESHYWFYPQVETHISALEELLDCFERKLRMSSKGKPRAKVAEFNYKDFLKECKQEFVPKANEFVDALNQQAYANGISRTLIALKLELLNACKESNQEIEGSSLPTLCIIWK